MWSISVEFLNTYNGCSQHRLRSWNLCSKVFVKKVYYLLSDFLSLDRLSSASFLLCCLSSRKTWLVQIHKDNTDEETLNSQRITYANAEYPLPALAADSSAAAERFSCPPAVKEVLWSTSTWNRLNHLSQTRSSPRDSSHFQYNKPYPILTFCSVYHLGPWHPTELVVCLILRLKQQAVLQKKETAI